MKIGFDPSSVSDYAKFLRVKSLPRYRFVGGFAEFPDEYAEMIGETAPKPKASGYKPAKWLFDYQRDITATAIKKKRYAVFADCGLGKTAILLEFARFVSGLNRKRRVLIVSPLMVETVLRKADRVHSDTEEQERIFRAANQR